MDSHLGHSGRFPINSIRLFRFRSCVFRTQSLTRHHKWWTLRFVLGHREPYNGMGEDGDPPQIRSDQIRSDQIRSDPAPAHPQYHPQDSSSPDQSRGRSNDERKSIDELIRIQETKNRETTTALALTPTCSNSSSGQLSQLPVLGPEHQHGVIQPKMHLSLIFAENTPSMCVILQPIALLARITV